MRIQLTSEDLARLSPWEPGLQAHCVRVCTLASEIASAAAIPARSALVLQQAAMLHHASEAVFRETALARLVGDVLNQAQNVGKTVEMPEALVAALRAYRSFPKRVGDSMADQLAEILALSNLIDEQIESREIDEPAAAPFGKPWNRYTGCSRKRSGIWRGGVFPRLSRIRSGVGRSRFSRTWRNTS